MNKRSNGIPGSWWRYAIISSLTLGLAPFNPPHLVGKVKWVVGGATGMQPIDWFDLFLHGVPWLVLIGLSIYALGASFLKKKV